MEKNFDNKLNIAIEEIRKITMAPEEKRRMFENITGSSAVKIPEKIPRSIKSPWTFFGVVSMFGKNRSLAYGGVCCLVLFASGGLAFASQGSLPGNILYPLKVSVVEPLRGAFKFSPEAKVEFQSTLATERLIEAETLSERGELDEGKEEKLSRLLEVHTEAMNSAIVKLNKNKSQNKSDDKEVDNSDGYDKAVTNFQADMNAHASFLETLDERKENPKRREGSVRVSDTARVSGNKIRENLDEDKRNKEAGVFLKTGLKSGEEDR